MIYDLGVTVEKAGTSIALDSKYYTEGSSYVYGGRENRFPATVSGVSGAAFTSLPEGEAFRLRQLTEPHLRSGTSTIEYFDSR